MNTSVVQPVQPFNLLGLPDYVVYRILRKLPFEELVKVLRTSKRLRDFAEGCPRLWRALPEVSVREIPELDRYMLLAKDRSVDLAVRDIRQGNALWDVADAVAQHLHHLRSLRLHFRNRSAGNDAGMKEIWDGLGRLAPELKRLAFDMDGHFGALSSIPDGVFLETPLPNLVELQVTAVKLEEFVPAFENVRTVRAAVASIAPFDRGANDKIHKHFPALRNLTLLGIQSLSAGGEVAHSLIKVPFIEKPLENLVLRFELQSAVIEPEVALWLEKSLPYARNAALIDNRCAATCNTFITSLNGPEARAIEVSPDIAGVRDLKVTTMSGRSRTVRFGGPIDRQFFVNLLALPGPVASLSIPADVSGTQILAGFVNAAHLEVETLLLEVSSGFALVPPLPVLGAVRTVRFNADRFVDVDAQAIVDFATNVTPGVALLSFSGLVRVRNSHLLQNVRCVQVN